MSSVKSAVISQILCVNDIGFPGVSAFSSCCYISSAVSVIVRSTMYIMICTFLCILYLVGLNIIM